MGIEALAVFPAIISIVAMAIIISGLQNIRQVFRAVSFSIILIACASAALFATVHIFEFLGLSIVGELFYLGVVGFVIYGGLRYGRNKFGFTNKELVLQGIIASFGCAAVSLCFLGWTVRI